MKTSPLAILFAIIALGVVVEVVEQQNKQAGYMLALVLLLGMITFNARAFQTGLGNLQGALLGYSRIPKGNAHQTGNKGRN